jgi:BirA family biotin operon repressor/biotin-[acetyl-CoA-carboxylase] ligase
VLVFASRVLERLAQQPEGVRPVDLASAVGIGMEPLTALISRLQDEGLRLELQDSRLCLIDAKAGWGPHTLAWRTGRPVHHHRSCVSTNRLARDLARQTPSGQPLPVVVADHQTAGRGRRGRRWSAESGQNFLFSVVLRPELPPGRVPRVILAWAAAMAEVLDVSLKWPNDLVVPEGTGMRKLGGILAALETGPSGDFSAGPVSVVFGVGINVGQTSFADLPQATSLALLGRSIPDRATLLGDLIRAIDAVDVHDPALLEPWRRRACMLGRTVRIGDVVGVAEGIREDGALMVSGRPVLAGDVEFIAP